MIEVIGNLDVLETTANQSEVLGTFGTQRIEHAWGLPGNQFAALLLAVEHAQRVCLLAMQAIFAKVLSVVIKIVDKLCTVCRPAVRAAKRVQLERSVRKAYSSHTIYHDVYHLDIGRGLSRADEFDANL